MRSKPRTLALAAAALLALPVAASAQESTNFPRSYLDEMADRRKREGGDFGRDRRGWTGESDEGEEDDRPEAEKPKRPKLPNPLGPVMDRLNPALAAYALEEVLGLDTGRVSPKPRAPEIPLALFRELIRPLGALKYENQFNYFNGSFSGGAPGFQSISYEYVFMDWTGARGELVWVNQQLEAWGAGLQRTLGVGPRHNWVHGITVVPEVLVRRRFVGGSAFYTFAWKPEEESHWSTTLTVGANRASFEGAQAAQAMSMTGPMGMMAMGRAGDLARGDTGREEEAFASAWRPLGSFNFWYTFSPKFTVGVENDALPHYKFGEYLVLPYFIWQPTQHFFMQAGGGYYQIGSQSQATFMVRVNLLNPSPRKPYDATPERQGTQRGTGE